MEKGAVFMKMISNNFFGVTSDSVSTLFGSVSKSGSQGATGNVLSDYYSIRNGSYKKLLTAYYNKTDSVSNQSTSTASDSTKKLAAMKQDANKLSESLNHLVKRDSSSVFKKGEDGYDMETIYKKVKDFVDSYNEVVDDGKTCNTTSALRTISNMVKDTAHNEKNLNAIGIKVGSDNKLSIDEEAFKKSDVTSIKSVFNGPGSYGYNVAAKASQLEYNVKTEANKANVYGNNGSYSYNYTAGELYDSTF